MNKNPFSLKEKKLIINATIANTKHKPPAIIQPITTPPNHNKNDFYISQKFALIISNKTDLFHLHFLTGTI